MGACVVDHFAADKGFQHPDRENLRGRDFRDVFRDDRQVGQFAFFERTLVLLLKLGISRLKGVTPQRFLERKPLLGVPAAWRTTVRILPRNGCIYSIERVERFAGEIRTPPFPLVRKR
jgi:hypothetical protein